MCRRVKDYNGLLRDEVMYSFNFTLDNINKMGFVESAVLESPLQVENNDFRFNEGESFFIDRVSSTLIMSRPFEAVDQFIQLRIGEKLCHKMTFSDFTQISPERYLFFSSFKAPEKTVRYIPPLQSFGFNWVAGPFMVDWSYRMEGRLLRPAP